MIDVLKAILVMLAILTLIVISIAWCGFGMPRGMAIYLMIVIVPIVVIGLSLKDGDK